MGSDEMKPSESVPVPFQEQLYVSKAFCICDQIRFFPTPLQVGEVRDFCAHFTDEGTETWRVRMSFQRPHRLLAQNKNSHTVSPSPPNPHCPPAGRTW